MAYKPKRLAFLCDEARNLKLQQILGKNPVNAKNFQQVVEKLIDNYFAKSGSRVIR